MIGGFIAPLGSIACGIGVLLTSAYALLISAHLMGIRLPGRANQRRPRLNEWLKTNNRAHKCPVVGFKGSY